MTRLPDWQHRLDSFLMGNSARKFRYGSFDCCLFVCDAVLAMTGVDMAEGFRGKYRTRTRALKVIKERFGRASVAAVAAGVTKQHAMLECSALMARRGDVAIIKRGRGDYSLGVVDLTGEWIAALYASGIQRIPLAQSMKAWHV